jgi:pyruvate kinase
MKKTKIICTMGPITTPELMKELVENGMDIARFNFSHGDHEEQLGRIEMLRKVRSELNKPIAMLLDTKGPEIRTGTLEKGEKITLETDDIFTLTTEEIVGNKEKVSISYAGLIDDIEVGKCILIDDGLIELEVTSIMSTDLVCKVKNGGVLGEKKGVNVPNVPTRLPAITEKDKEDIRFGVEQDMDFIAASFVRNAECILEIKKFLAECNAPYTPIIAKIENAEGIKNIDEIIRCADGIMVARGDLGVEIPAEELPHLQKMIVQKCNDHYKPVIIATQMLDSMMRNPRPTRAEVTDVANAVYDGTDAVMLSGETAAGKFPIEALNMMEHIILNTEEHLDYELLLRKSEERGDQSVSSAIAFATVSAARKLTAKCIITPTISGATTRVVSKFRPEQEIIGITPDERTLRRMQIFWGVRPVKSIEYATTTAVTEGAIEVAKAKNLVQAGNVVVLTAGIPSPHIELSARDGDSNMMSISVVN